LLRSLALAPRESRYVAAYFVVGRGRALFYGLAIQDSQIRALLGEPPPNPPERAKLARLAVSRFIKLAAPLESA
jgi:hypothetical protein